MSVHHKYTKDFKEKIENLIKFNTILTQKMVDSKNNLN